MVNFSGYNRGFAFITYFNPTDAWRAVKQLNDFEVRPDCHIGVSKSVDNCRLYIGGIPTEKTREEAWNELNENLQGITSIIMYPDRTDRALNRGFMFVEFCSHRAAAMAKRKMSPGTVQLWDKNVTVDWADPEPDIDPNVLSNVRRNSQQFDTPHAIKTAVTSKRKLWEKSLLELFCREFSELQFLLC